MIARGRKSNALITKSTAARSSPVPKVSTLTDTGFAIPIA
jgi:hypothetical protein